MRETLCTFGIKGSVARTDHVYPSNNNY